MCECKCVCMHECCWHSPTISVHVAVGGQITLDSGPTFHFVLDSLLFTTKYTKLAHELPMVPLSLHPISQEEHRDCRWGLLCLLASCGLWSFKLKSSYSHVKCLRETLE